MGRREYFSWNNLLGEGGFGPVYKGFVDDKLKPGLEAQPVAMKVLDLEGLQGHREWLAEIVFLGQLRHPNLVKLIGYCSEEEHRLLVYEYMARGSLADQLFQRYSAALLIYWDFKTSNILLDSNYTAKLSDFGLAKDGLEGDDTHITSIMGTQGYAAPEYIMTGFNSKLQRLLGFRLLCALVGLLKTFWFRRANAWLIHLGAVSASICLPRWWDEEFG